MARSRFRRFIPGRGTGRTIITAVKNTDLTAIDGSTVLKAGETKIYDFDLSSSLRTYLQRKTLNHLVDSGHIEMRRGPTTEEPVATEPPDDPEESSESAEPEESSESAEPDEESSSEAEGDSVVDDTVPVSEEEGAEATDEQEPDTTEEETAPESPAPSDPLASMPLETEAADACGDDCGCPELSEEDRYTLLRAIKGVGEQTARALLDLPRPASDEAVKAVPRFPRESKECVAQAVEVLSV